MDQIELSPLTHSQFALINPLQVERSAWEDLQLVPLVNTAIASKQHLMPMLMDLNSLPITRKGQLLERSTRWMRDEGVPFFSALLASASSFREVQNHLEARLIVRGPHDIKSFLRYFDPQVFIHLQWIYDTQQIAALMGPLMRWSVWDENGRWQSFERPSVDDDSKHPFLFRHTPKQIGQLENLGLVRRCLRALPQDKQNILEARRISGLIEIGQGKYGLTDEADLQLFVRQATTVHPRIHLHPLLSNRLEQVSRDKITYLRVCADLDDTALRKAAYQLNAEALSAHTETEIRGMP